MKKSLIAERKNWKTGFKAYQFLCACLSMALFAFLLEPSNSTAKTGTQTSILTAVFYDRRWNPLVLRIDQTEEIHEKERCLPPIRGLERPLESPLLERDPHGQTIGRPNG